MVLRSHPQWRLFVEKAKKEGAKFRWSQWTDGRRLLAIRARQMEVIGYDESTET